MLYGAGKLALLLAALYAVYRLGRYARDRFQQRFARAGADEPGAAPHPLGRPWRAQRGAGIVVRWA